ncbi:tetratricopeptide repeat protein [Patescibacteria group bacterium]|nr:tetratricopeptide repeat protein [Patescibacteria group bacterium]
MLESKFKIFILISISLVLTTAIFIYFNPAEQVKVSSFNNSVDLIFDSSINNIEVNLSEQERQGITEQIKTLQKKLNDFSSQQGVNLSESYLLLGINYESLGLLDKARQSYLWASQQNPFISVPWSNLGSLYEQVGDYELAKQALKKATEIEPTMVINWSKLIELNRYRLGSNQGAIRELYNKSFLATDHNLDLHHSFARYLENIGSIQDAILEYRFIISKNNKDQIASQELARLTGKIR